ncbi:ATP-binding protein [Streptomyces sp. HMX87]|uniref:ATP-binding protein n=1 Tax=Streptomyces sp. HMX87 TaxID=3390849 RepID=UPI003A865A65
MAVPLMKQADEHEPGALRRRVSWGTAPPMAAQARSQAEALLADLAQRCGTTFPESLVNDVRLVVSELIANVARHAPGPGGLQLEAPGRGHVLRITVWDTSPAMPHPQPRDPERASGHGLEIVNAVSSRLWMQPHGRGKAITAELPLASLARVDALRPA